MTNTISLKEFNINIEIDNIKIRAIDAISKSYARCYVLVYIICKKYDKDIVSIYIQTTLAWIAIDGEV